MPTPVQPGMTLPVNSGTATFAPNGNSMNVSFAVQAPDFGTPVVEILLSLCLVITIGTVTIKICYTRLVNASGQIETFNSILPINSVIESATPTFDIVEPAVV